MGTMNLVPATVADFRRLAEKRLPRAFFDYIDGGSGAETTLAANAADLDALRLRQRVLRDVSQLDTSATLLGRPLPLPLVLGPIGLAGLFARRGEVQAARAAEAAGLPFCLSTVSICSIEEVRAATKDPFWFQLYVMKDRGYVKELVQRAKAAGCGALVLTVDLAVTGARYRDVRNGMLGQGLTLGGKLRRVWNIASHAGWLTDVMIKGKPVVFGNLQAAVPDGRNLQAFRAWVDAQFDASVNWRDLEWFRGLWDGPLVVKGILDPDDARMAADAGAQAIILSNHGGRQLDGAPSAAAVLPRVAEAVGHRVDLMMDGGIRSGQDIVKARALG
ncbi:MAG TPA: L-lactate dehydrogenase, partial [Rhodocyclaceae bacterium]|nr:L-lactate dehydrogenase [Rhodocyclaceae bacterium]